MFIKPFDAIIVGIDFSKYSRTVMKQAEALAKHWRAPLVVVYAFNEPIDAASTLYVSIRKTLGPDFYRDRIKSFYKLKSKPFQCEVEFATPSALLMSTARKFKRPLLVVGYQGHSRLAEFIFGSTARHLATHAESPLWIHRGEQVVLPRRVLIAHDLSDESNRGIDIFKEMDLLQTMTYRVYFVREKPFPVLDYPLYKSVEEAQLIQEQKQIHSLLTKYPKLDFQATTGEVTEKLVQKTRQFDLILVTHRRRKEFYSASETLHLMRKSEKPVLIV